MIYLTEEQAQQIEEALDFAASHDEYLADDLILYGDALSIIRAAKAQEHSHPDDEAVDRFAAAMKAKLANKRSEGRGGWEDKNQCSAEFLNRLLNEHVGKGDPVDVGNLAMMLWNRGERTEARAQEQAEQEPVGEVDIHMDFLRINWKDGRHPPKGTKLYTAPVEPVKQEPVALEEIRRIVAEYIEPNSQVDSGNLFWALCGALQYIDANLKFNVPTHPIRTKDLTDRELADVIHGKGSPLGLFPETIRDYRLIIDADREKNK